MKKLGIVILLIVLLMCVGTGIVGFTVANKIKSGDYSFMSIFSFLNKTTSTDLGITFTDEDVTKVHQAIQSEAKALTSDSPECKTSVNCTSGKTVYIGKQRIETTLTNEQGTGLINEWIRLSSNAPFTSAQMRVNADGTVDFAGIIDMQQVKNYGVAGKIPAATMDLFTKYVGALGETFPIRASGTLTIKNNNVDANFSSIQLGILPVPKQILTEYKATADSFIEDRLKVVDSFSIEELSFKDGKTTYKGTIPKTVYFVK